MSWEQEKGDVKSLVRQLDVHRARPGPDRGGLRAAGRSRADARHAAARPGRGEGQGVPDPAAPRRGSSRRVECRLSGALAAAGPLLHASPASSAAPTSAPDGIAHLDAIARWLQDAAFADGIDAGLATGRGVGDPARRRCASSGCRVSRSELELRTWCGGDRGRAPPSGARRSRATRGAAVEAEAIWVHIDPETRRPARFRADFLDVYAGERRGAPAAHEAAPPGRARRGRRASASGRFAAADIDLAGHVNNAVYWRVLEESSVPAARRRAGPSSRPSTAAGIGAGTATRRARRGRRSGSSAAEGETRRHALAAGPPA